MSLTGIVQHRMHNLRHVSNAFLCIRNGKTSSDTDNTPEIDESELEVSTRRWRTSSSPPDSTSATFFSPSVVSTPPLELQLLAADSTTAAISIKAGSSTTSMFTRFGLVYRNTTTSSRLMLSSYPFSTKMASLSTTFQAAPHPPEGSCPRRTLLGQRSGCETRWAPQSRGREGRRKGEGRRQERMRDVTIQPQYLYLSKYIVYL